MELTDIKKQLDAASIQAINFQMQYFISLQEIHQQISNDIKDIDAI